MNLTRCVLAWNIPTCVSASAVEERAMGLQKGEELEGSWSWNKGTLKKLASLQTLAQVGQASSRWLAVGREGKGAGRSYNIGESLGKAGLLPW